VGIAVVTGQSEVSISSAKLMSDDLLGVIGQERLGLVRHAAVFAVELADAKLFSGVTW
jgi:hypothetical protein